MFTAFTSIREYALPVAHDALEMGTELLRFAPVAGLAEAARVLLTIWDSLQFVEVCYPSHHCFQLLISYRLTVLRVCDSPNDAPTFF